MTTSDAHLQTLYVDLLLYSYVCIIVSLLYHYVLPLEYQVTRKHKICYVVNQQCN